MKPAYGRFALKLQPGWYLRADTGKSLLFSNDTEPGKLHAIPHEQVHSVYAKRTEQPVVELPGGTSETRNVTVYEMLWTPNMSAKTRQSAEHHLTLKVSKSSSLDAIAQSNSPHDF